MTDDSWRGMLPDTIRRATGSIYHYTSAAGLLGLVENGELWATEATGMNDLAEVRQGWEFIRKWVADQDQNDQVTKIILAACEPDNLMSRPDGIFMLCASTRADDANQWRLYGGRARGYAVELDASAALSALARDDSRSGALQPKTPASVRTLGDLVEAFQALQEMAFISPWLHVLYSEERKVEALDRLAENARSLWFDHVGPDPLEDPNQDPGPDQDRKWQGGTWYTDFRDLVMAATAQVAHLMKSEGFSGEHEVRTIVQTPFDACSKFRPTEAGIVRYVRLTAGTTGLGLRPPIYRKDAGPLSVPLLHVCLGPLIDKDTNTATIEELLKRNGYTDAKVSASLVPLRL